MTFDAPLKGQSDAEPDHSARRLLVVEILGLLIALGFGVWAYADAKRLQGQGIRVGSFSPAGWGWAVGLLAIVFGIMYLVQRPKALAAGPPPNALPVVGSIITRPAPPAPSWSPPALSQQVPVEDARYCTACGTAMRADASYCPGCGREIIRDRVS